VNVQTVFLLRGNETKKASLTFPGPPFAPKTHALFEKKFGAPPPSGAKIYVCDPGSTIFYELESFHAIQEGSQLRLHSVHAAQNGTVPPTSGDLASVVNDIRAIKEVIASPTFQAILATPQLLEAENKVFPTLFFFFFRSKMLASSLTLLLNIENSDPKNGCAGG